MLNRSAARHTRKEGMNRGVKRRLELDCHVDVLMGLRVGIEMGMEKQIGRVGWKAKRGLGLL